MTTTPNPTLIYTPKPSIHLTHFQSHIPHKPFKSVSSSRSGSSSIKCSNPINGNNGSAGSDPINNGGGLKNLLSGIVDERVDELLNREENRVLLDGLDKATQRVEMAKRELEKIEQEQIENNKMKEYINQLEIRAAEIEECQKDLIEARAICRMNMLIVCSFKQMMRLLHTILFFSALVIYTDSKSVEVTKGINGLEKVKLSQTHGSSVEVYLYGAHVTSWKNDQGEELLFVSSKATFSPPKPIRGGIPVVFPQFSNLGSLQSHGFARNRFWTIDNNPSPDISKITNGVFVDLLLKPTDEDLKIWPHRFEFRMRVTLTPGGNLVLTSSIRNTDAVGKPFNFTFAHHTYFSISNISEVEVKGMAKLDYLDNLKNRTRYTETRDTITFNSEFDRIYLSTPKKIAVLDHKKKQTIVIRKDGLPDAVVWNPGEKKAKTIVDLGEGEYKYFVAVEAAAIGKPVTLKPGEEWNGRLELSTIR